MHIDFICGGKPYALTAIDLKNYTISIPVEVVDKETGKPKTIWTGKFFFSDLGKALEHILNMKVRKSDATTLQELKEEIQKARAEIISEFSTEINMNEKQKPKEIVKVTKTSKKSNVKKKPLRKKK